MPYYKNITLAILAGGKATRMGGVNKALLTFERQTFIQRIYSRLSPLFVKTIIISDEIVDFGLPSVNVYPDIIHGIGPLGGVHSSLENSQTPYAFVVSCDMPFVDSNIATKIVDHFLKGNFEIVVPQINSQSEPLFAVYSKSLMGEIEDMVAKDGSKAIRDLFLRVETGHINFDNTQTNSRCFTNINYQNDFESL